MHLQSKELKVLLLVAGFASHEHLSVLITMNRSKPSVVPGAAAPGSEKEEDESDVSKLKNDI